MNWKFLLQRLSEPSTWAGFAAVIPAVAPSLAIAPGVATAAGVVAAVLAVLGKEGGGTPPAAGGAA
ncbi:hypothetical protein [Pandoraea sp. 64-18]|uniref:hypothetical protein n=1 Tax=Pandoraea sp. 64-18 TaxID=1895806 RepID=UPI00095D0627|nr:hypothetical protein [Pandoraea sp. 64-18]OJY20758.1 MAG: hypothetical protein BGP02_09905 [Pandoraea sp. 64-18]